MADTSNALSYDPVGPQRRMMVFASGDSESLMVSQLDSEHFRLEESSVLGEAYYHDIVRALARADGALEFREIATRSSLQTQSWILSKTIIEYSELESVLEKVMSMGGMWERVFSGLFLVHVPPEFARAISERIEAIYPDSKA